MAASASARGGNEGGNGAEVGGRDARLEMRKVRRGCIVDDGSGCRMLGVFRGSVIIIVVHQLHEKEKKKEPYEL